MIKGTAILMMIAHHCFAFPHFWIDNFRVGTIPMVICDNFKICVAMFAFITGYGFYAGKGYTYKDYLGKIWRFLGQYWIQLFLIFLPVASVSYRFSIKKILYNMIALYDNIILFAWYVFFHCSVLLIFPLVKKMLNKCAGWDLLVVLVGGYSVTVFFFFQPLEGALFSMLLDCSIFYPVVGMGYLSAKYVVFERLGHKLSFVGAVVLILAILLLRTQVSVVKGFTFDVIYAPLLILALCRVLEKRHFLRVFLIFLGKHSFHMWMFHSIFFSVYTRDLAQPLINWVDLPTMRFLLVTVLSLAAAVLVDRLWRYCMLLKAWLCDQVRR